MWVKSNIVLLCAIEVPSRAIKCGTVFSHDRFLEERSYRRCVESCLEETIVVYVDHLLTQVCPLLANLFHENVIGFLWLTRRYASPVIIQRNYISEDMLERIRLDEEVLTAFFSIHVNQQVRLVLKTRKDFE
mgnify:FL=1